MNWFLILTVIFWAACSQTEKKEEVQEVEADVSKASFPNKHSYLRAEKKSYEGTLIQCSDKKNLESIEDIFSKATHCYYIGEKKKSYYIFKLLLSRSDNQDYKPMILNNLGVIQSEWGNLELAQSLFKDSLSLNSGEVNSYNYQNVRLMRGESLEKDSHLDKIYTSEGEDISLKMLKAQAAFSLKRSDDFIKFSEELNLQDSKMLINYIYGLKQLEKYGVANLIVQENKEALEEISISKALVEEIKDYGEDGKDSN